MMKKNEFEQLLNEKLDKVTDSRVRDAMRYSLTAGGKRIRPTLLYLVLEGYGEDPALGNETACALEMIHTYSLIHDDLPAMDNDDLRRGRPTNHKQFDEATAILAGDGLLTEAFACAAETRASADKVLKCICMLAQSAGPSGMVYGQCLDINEDKNVMNFEDIRKVYKYKTGCLLSVPLAMASVLAGRDEETTKQWEQIGFDLGLAFQIQDDILDVTATAEELGKSNSDERNDKVTSVTTLGMDEARRLMNSLYEDCLRRCAEMPGFRDEKISELIRSVMIRTY